MMPSCTSDAPDNEEVSKDFEMSFAVSVLSRASETVPFNKFAVYGDMSSKNVGPMIIFDKTNVVKNENGIWNYDGTRYWFPEFEHSFVAVTPVSVLEADNNPQYSNSRLSFVYAIPTTDGIINNKNNVSDIIAATHRRLYDKNDKNSTIPLSFSHILSLINIAPALDDNIMTNDEFIEFNKLELSGFRTEAAFDIFPAARLSNSQTDDRVIDVTGQTKEGNLIVEFAVPVKVSNNRENVSLFEDNDAIIMLPQTFTADSNAKIILSYTINNDPTIKQITLPLKSQEWESGKSYTYRFTISRKGLLSESTAITDWDVLTLENINAK